MTHVNSIGDPIYTQCCLFSLFSADLLQPDLVANNLCHDNSADIVFIIAMTVITNINAKDYQCHAQGPRDLLVDIA